MDRQIVIWFLNQGQVSPRKKLKKIRNTYDTQTVLYFLFTPVYFGITPALLDTANLSNYATQIDTWLLSKHHT